MSAHDLVVACIRDALHGLVDEVGARPEDDFRILSYGSERRGEQHYVVRRGDELVRVTIERTEEP